MREERLSSLISRNQISCPAVAALINEARDACYALTEKESETADEQRRIQIRWMLTEIDGEKAVRSMNPDELAEWVVDLVNGEGLDAADYGEIVRAIMRME